MILRRLTTPMSPKQVLRVKTPKLKEVEHYEIIMFVFVELKQ